MLQRKHLAWAVDMFPTARKCGIRVSKKNLGGCMYVCVPGRRTHIGKKNPWLGGGSLLAVEDSQCPEANCNSCLVGSTFPPKAEDWGEKVPSWISSVFLEPLHHILGFTFTVLTHSLWRKSAVPEKYRTDGNTGPCLIWILYLDRSGMINV